MLRSRWGWVALGRLSFFPRLIRRCKHGLLMLNQRSFIQLCMYVLNEKRQFAQKTVRRKQNERHAGLISMRLQVANGSSVECNPARKTNPIHRVLHFRWNSLGDGLVFWRNWTVELLPSLFEWVRTKLSLSLLFFKGLLNSSWSVRSLSPNLLLPFGFFLSDVYRFFEVWRVCLGGIFEMMLYWLKNDISRPSWSADGDTRSRST